MDRALNAGRALWWARRHAELSQRHLAERAGVAQPTIARIESGHVVPGVGTLDRLLRASGHMLTVVPLRGVGIDRSQIRTLLDLTPLERLQAATAAARSLAELDEAARSLVSQHGAADPR